jgi:hypothetical protein
MKKILSAGTALAVVTLACVAFAQQGPTPKIEAVYWMSAETVSGMATGRPDGVEKNLMLQLGSSRSQSAPSAAHVPPLALWAGDRLPLVTPKHASQKPDSPTDYRPGVADGPKGRIELYWGCGESAESGQPFVVDLSKLRPGGPSPFGAVPQVNAMAPPSQGRHATYGEWPSGQKGTRVPRDASLAGAHLVQGNYSPDMRFTVGNGADFLAPLAPKHAAMPSGAVMVNWPALANARGYILTVVAARDDGTTLMWTSSAIRMPGMALPDYLAESEAARLVQQRILLAPTTTQCAVPAAVAKASESAMLMMTAYGAEANYGSPRDAPLGWAVKLRTRSTHMGMLGMDIAAMMRGEDAGTDEDEAPAETRPKKKRGLLRGVIGGTLGIPG